jgi:hypothetical protein
MSDLPDVSITTTYNHLSLASKTAATLALHRASSGTKRKDSWPDAPLGPSRFSITRLPSGSEAGDSEAGAMRGQTLGKFHPPKVGRLRRWLLLLLPIAVVLNYLVFRADAPYLLWGSRRDATGVLGRRDGDLRREGGGGGELLRDKMALENWERLRELQRKEWGEGRDGQTVGLGTGGWETGEVLGVWMGGVSEEGVSRKQMEAASKDASEDGGDDDNVDIKHPLLTPLVGRGFPKGGETGESAAQSAGDPHFGGVARRGSGLLMQDLWDDDEEEAEEASSGEGLHLKEEARSVKEERLEEERGMSVRSAGDEGALKLTEGESSGGHILGGNAAERGTADSKNQSILAEMRLEDAGKKEVSNSGTGLGQGLENPREGGGQGYSDAQEVRSEAQSAESHGGAAGSGAEPLKSVKVSKPRRYLYFSETIDDGQTGGLIHQVCIFSLCFLAFSHLVIEPRTGYLSFGFTNEPK